MKKLLNKNRIAVLMVVLMIIGGTTLFHGLKSAKAQTQPSTVNPLSFYLTEGSGSIAAGTTKDIEFCSVQSDSVIGGSIPWANGATDFFRIGNNLATVNSLGAITVTRWQFATAGGNDLTAGDLSSTVNAAGKIVLTNTSGVSRDVTHGMTICITANVTAVGSAITNIVDNSNALLTSTNPREAIFKVF